MPEDISSSKAKEEDSKLPSHARVVVIGGGVVGCSILYHLTLHGWKDVVLLEKNELFGKRNPDSKKKKASKKEFYHQQLESI